MSKNVKKADNASEEDKEFPLPIYDEADDIYSKEEEVSIEDGEIDITPEGDLDIPGSELDDADENIGEEDEENNFYSIGGDNHNDLEEERE
ncbi:MAG: hypothetical protein ABI472_07865 [Ginsengibacter sp.]